MNPTTDDTRHRAFTKIDPRWSLLATRDPAADGQFFYSVKSTGIYCRPSCAARLPRPENVQFHATCADAEQAGFRPCKRCKPRQSSVSAQHATKIAAVCRLIETSEELPSLAEMAKHAGLSAYHFHRLFKSTTGVTPKAYGAAKRAARVREELKRSGSVTEAIYSAGYNSNSRFYEDADRFLGMTPTNFRAGGADTKICFAVGECSLGAVLVAASDRGVCAIFLADEPETLVRELQDLFPRAQLIGGDAEFEASVAKLIGYVDNPARGLDLPLDIRGTAFQLRVWQALREIPVGSTASYTEVAKRIGAPKSARAVARACAANVLAIAIPCHRVVRTDGSCSGYRWGIERKRALLKKESQA
jgi:AraC family transcriptional regulator of adaptative response/methylated-DNA-[protein]-cysteine methyltransferase